MKAANCWQDASGKKWAELQPRTDAQLGPLGRAAMALVAPRRGELVLDVGCGAGESAFELAAHVAPDGSVVGIDVSPQLLERARERAAEEGVGNVEFVLGDAALEHFDRPFDVLYSRFGVMFFEDPPRAFATLRKTLRAGGRLGFVCWQACEQNPMMQAPLTAVRELRPEHPLPEMLEPGAPGPFSLSDRDAILALLAGAGFADVEVLEHEADVPFGGSRSLDEAVDFALRIGPAARFVADAGLAEDPRVPHVLGAALAPYATDRGVWMPARTLLVTARNPAER